jgi:hypothetical protein
MAVRLVGFLMPLSIKYAEGENLWFIFGRGLNNQLHNTMYATCWYFHSQTLFSRQMLHFELNSIGRKEHRSGLRD